MNIQSIKWVDAEHTSLRVTLDDGRVMSCPWPCATWHRERLQAWLDAGGVIQPEDPPPAPIDLSDFDNVEKAIKAMGLVIAQFANKTPAEVKAAFKAKWDSLP